MAEIIALWSYQEEPDFETMEKEELLVWLGRLREQIRELDAREPRNMNTEAYETWADRHEELEDLVDEILDRLDELP